MSRRPPANSTIDRPHRLARPNARRAVVEAVGEGPHERRLSALSAAVARIATDHGRRPTGASSWWLEEGCVVTALEDFLTPAEHALVEKGEAGAVRQLRHAFGEAITDEYIRVAEGALGRKVIAHRSELVCAPDVCLEIFLLANEQRVPGVGPSSVPPSYPRRLPR